MVILFSELKARSSSWTLFKVAAVLDRVKCAFPVALSGSLISLSGVLYILEDFFTFSPYALGWG